MTTEPEKSRKLEIYDPPMCCSSGVCGPKVDQTLVAFAATLQWLRTQGVEVERFNPSHQFDCFAANPAVVKAINDSGMECLPLILLNGIITSRASYPSKAELAAMVGLE